MKNVLVGYFDVPNYGTDSVETPLTGNGTYDNALLQDLIAKRHPKVDPRTIRKTGSVIQNRDAESESAGFVEIEPGTTLRQLFTDSEGKTDPVRKVGKVFFAGTPADIFIVFQRARGIMSIALQPVLKNEGNRIAFSNQINVQQLASELPRLIADTLGSDARELVLNIREKTPNK